MTISVNLSYILYYFIRWYSRNLYLSFFKYYFSVILTLLYSLLSYSWSRVSHALQYHTACTIQSDLIFYWRSNQLFYWEELVTNNYQLAQRYFAWTFLEFSQLDRSIDVPSVNQLELDHAPAPGQSCLKSGITFSYLCPAPWKLTFIEYHPKVLTGA